MNTFLLHCYFEWNLHFTYANNLGVLDFLVCPLTDNHRILLSARRTPSVALELNLNRLIHFSHIVINARPIPSLKLIFISFLKDEAQRTKQLYIRDCFWDTRSDYGFRCVCVFIKIHRYIAGSRHQLIRRLNNIKRFIVCRAQILFTICLFRVKIPMCFVYRVCNFMEWTWRIDRLRLG